MVGSKMITIMCWRKKAIADDSLRNGVEKMPQAITRSRSDTELPTRRRGKGAIMEQVIHLEGANFGNFKPIIIFASAKGWVASRVAWWNLTPTPSQVGSGIGAPTVGSGGSSRAFAVGLSPAPLVTFPTPASSNPAYGFPVPGFPANFT